MGKAWTLGVVVVLAVHAPVLVAAAPPAESSSASAGGVRREIGPGTYIEIPSAWTVGAEEISPAPNAIKFRIAADGLQIVVTRMARAGSMRSTEDLERMLESADQEYVAGSEEKAFNPVSFESRTAHGVLASFTVAAPPASASASAMPAGSKLTTAVVAKQDLLFLFTVSMTASSAAATRNHQAAVAAIQSIE